MNEELETEVTAEAEPAAQQYEGDDVSALMTAKERMAKRDAEYSAKFAAFAAKDDPKPPRKRAAKQKPVQKALPVVEEEAPVSSKPAAEEPVAPVEKPVSAVRKGGSMDYDTVKNSSLRAASKANPEREEFSRAWRKN